jgi:hypothetical protein
MPSNFDSQEQTLTEIFSGNNRYEIPVYQRPYSWHPDEHVEQLWDDLIEAWKNNGGSEYFLGALILVESGETYEVLDGQQRLTSLIISYAVTRDYFQDRLETHHINQIETALQDSTARGEPYRLSTNAVGGDETDLQTSILSRVNPDAENNYARAAKKTKEKFEQGFDSAREFRSFFDYLQDNIVLIRIETSSLANAVKLFQTVNTRGKDLTISDLTKSYLLSQTDNEDEETGVIGTWDNLTSLFDNNYDTLDSILASYRLYRYEAEADESIYAELKAEFDDMLSNEMSVVEVVADIEAYARCHPDAEHHTSPEYFMLNNLSHEQHWKTVLTTAQKHGFDKTDELLEDLVAFYYSYWIGDYTAAKIKKPSREFIERIKDGKGIDSIRGKISSKRENDNIPSRCRQQLHEELYDGSPESWLIPLLTALEYQTSAEVGDPIKTGKRLHIEHILPKSESVFDGDSTTDYWKNQFSKEQAKEIKHRFGNLVLLEGEYNKRAQTRPYSEKVKIYTGREGEYEGLPVKAKNTDFEITRHVTDEYDDWSVDNIREFRGYLLERVGNLLHIDADRLKEEDISE